MAIDIKVPSVGESVTEGTVSRWLKRDGDPVRAGENVMELETEKATADVPAPAAGILRISAAEGSTVSIGAVVGRIEEGGATPQNAKPEKAGSSSPSEAKSQKPAPEPAPKPESEPPQLSPAARHLVEEKNLQGKQIQGTGPKGLVTKEDVVTHLEQKAQPAPAKAEPVQPKPAAGERETRQRMTSIRARIADRLLAAKQNAAILTTFNEADMSALMALRAKYKESFQKKHGVGLGFMSFFVKAAIEALKAFPVANAWIDGQDVVYHHYFNIGVAVSTERGLMVPVLRDADRLSFADIEKQIAGLATKARESKITVDDLQGGTFTITNGGVFGSLLSTPILNAPQSAILGMHTIQKRPVAVNDQVVIRPMMYLALSYDHRLIDGREAVQFLVRVKECVEDPERLLLEI